MEPHENPSFARHILEENLKYTRPYESTYVLRMYLNRLNDKNDLKLAMQYMFYDDWNLILGSTDALQRLGVSLDQIFDIYKSGLKDSKKREIALLALERLGYVPKDDEERFAFYLKHKKYDELDKEMPDKILVLFKLLIKESDPGIYKAGINVIEKHYSPSHSNNLLNLFIKNPHPDTAELLSQFNVKESVPYLIKLILITEKGEDKHTTPHYIRVLSKFKNSGTIDLFLKLAIEHSEDKIHESAVLALANIGNPRVIPSLLQRYISQKNYLGYYSSSIENSLTLYGNEILPYLVRELENENSDIRKLVIETLKKLSWVPGNAEEKDLFEGKLTKKVAFLLIDSTNAVSCIKAMDYFASHNDISATDKILPLLYSNDRTIQFKAYSTLRTLNWVPIDQREKICFAIFANDWKILVNIGQPAVRQLLIEMLRLKRDNLWDPKIRLLMNTISEIQDLSESNFDLLQELVDDVYFQDFALDEIEKKGNVSINLLSKILLNYNGYNKSIVLSKVVAILTKLKSPNVQIILIKAMPELEKDINEKIVTYLLENKSEYYQKDFTSALNSTIKKLFIKLSAGYDYSLILKKLGADENKIVDTCIVLLLKLERPEGYDSILEFFILIRSHRVIEPIFKLVKIPKPGAEYFYKDLVLTIGKIGDSRALPYLFDLLNSKWQLIDERNHTRITDSKWIEPEIHLAIANIKNSKRQKLAEIDIIQIKKRKFQWWPFYN